MNAELLIRPSFNDHRVVADLLAATTPGVRRPVSRLVLNAQDAARQPEFATIAAKSGTPVLVDPMTVLLQSEVAPEDAWVKSVPFGRADALSENELNNPFFIDLLVAQTLEFQVDQGATAIVPPYFYAKKPDSPAFAASLTAIGRMAKRMRSEGVSLPLVPVLAAQLRSFLHRPDWQLVLDRFAAAAVDVGPQALAMYFSPIGNGKDDNYAKVRHLVDAGRHLASYGVPTFAWRQGFYGPALVAAGLSGYETGLGVGERADIAGYQGQHKPKKNPKSGGGSPAGIYITALGRSVHPKLARVLLTSRQTMGRMICKDVRCCPHGAESMVEAARPHAARARARDLGDLMAIPNQAWRLHHVARQAGGAHVLATKANELAAAAKLSERIPTKGYESLEQVAEDLRTQSAASARDSA